MFMESTGKCDAFRWPKPPDELWITEQNIITEIEEPVPTGKTKRLFKLSPQDTELFKLACQ